MKSLGNKNKIRLLVLSVATAAMLSPFINMDSGHAAKCALAEGCLELLRAIREGQATDKQNQIEPLNSGEILDLAARRFGYGISPVETSLVPDKMTQARLSEVAWILYRQTRGADATLGAEVAGEFVPEIMNAYSRAELERVRNLVAVKLGLDPYNLSAMTRAALKTDGELDFVNFNTATVRKETSRLQDLAKANPALKLEAGTVSTQISLGIQNAARTASLMRALMGSQYEEGGRMRDTQLAFNEVAHEFWANHFNIDYGKAKIDGLGSAGIESVIRAHRNSSYRQLLGAVIKSPAMLIYLDNYRNFWDNTEKRPSNQNLGRELLELHTFGMGPRNSLSDQNSPYNQADVEVASTVLTGHNVIWGGQPYFWGYKFVSSNAFAGDFSKRFWSSRTQTERPIFFTHAHLASLDGTRPADRLDYVLDQLAAAPRTRANICAKLSARFARTSSIVNEMAERCRDVYGKDGVQGNLKEMYLAIASTPAFWSRTNGNTPANPLEAVILGVRATGIDASSFLAQSSSDYDSEKVHAFAGYLNRKIAAMGLSYKRYGDPTGYDMRGAYWLSQGYLIGHVRLSFELAHLDRMFDLPTRERVFRSSPANQREISALAETGNADVQQTVVDLLYGPAQRTNVAKIGEMRSRFLRDIARTPAAADLDYYLKSDGRYEHDIFDTVVSIGKSSIHRISK